MLSVRVVVVMCICIGANALFAVRARHVYDTSCGDQDYWVATTTTEHQCAHVGVVSCTNGNPPISTRCVSSWSEMPGAGYVFTAYESGDAGCVGDAVQVRKYWNVPCISNRRAQCNATHLEIATHESGTSCTGPVESTSVYPTNQCILLSGTYVKINCV